MPASVVVLKRIKKCPDSLFVGAKLGVADNRGRVPAAHEIYSRAAEWTVTDNTKLRFVPSLPTKSAAICASSHSPRLMAA